MKTILFVCTGNTCRSPICEGLFKRYHGASRLGLQSGSAGIFTTEGLPASPNAIAAALELGADISAHRSQLLTRQMVEKATYLVCMTGAQYDQLLRFYPESKDKIFTLAPDDIDDPFGGPIETYRKAARQIDTAIRLLMQRLETQNT